MLKNLLQAFRRRPGRKPEAISAGSAGEPVGAAMQRYQSGDKAAAAALCRTALALDPSQAGAWSLLARIALDDKQAQRALECYAHILAIHPDQPDYLIDAAEINRRAGHLGRALDLSGHALSLRPRDRRAWQVHGAAMEELGRLDEATQCLREELRLSPEEVDTHSNLLHLLNRSGLAEPEAVTAEHLAWAARHTDHLMPAQAEFGCAADPLRRLRVGYVSADFRRHAAAYYMEPVLRHHRRERFEVYCYSNASKSDEVTERFRRLCAHWRDIAGVDDATAADMVRDDRIDILVDLSGHTHGNRLLLFARKPAPIQATYMGYLGTSGMAAMDLRITDPHIDPVGVAEPLSRERLLRLPHGIVCYQPPPDAPQVNALPALQRGYLTFGSFNSFPKLTDATKRAWARLRSGLRLRMRNSAPLDAPGLTAAPEALYRDAWAQWCVGKAPRGEAC